MTLSNWFFGGSSGLEYRGDKGSEITNSLRFRGAQQLKRTPSASGNLNTWTWSCWVKKARFDIAQPMFCANSISDADQMTSWTPQIDQFGMVWRDTIQGTVQVEGKQRDCSAWYHLVYRWDYSQPSTSRMRIYINGVEQSLSTNTAPNSEFTINSTEAHAIGTNRAGGLTPTQYFEGYMAEMYMVDGSSLEPTTFGRYNTEGVWVPREPDFADPFGDWNWSDDLVAIGSTFSGAGQPENAFNGQTGVTQAAELTGNGSIIWYPTPNITAQTSIRVFTPNANCFCEVNSLGSVALTSGDWTEVSNGAAFPITISSINVARSAPAGSPPAVSAYEIDGQIYINGINPSYGLNGFHLDFSDPNDIGADRSGNGNDFTPTGFDTAPVGVFSNELTTNGTWGGGQPATQCFDGSDLTEGTSTTSDGTNCFVEFGPATPIDITGQTVQLFTYNQPSTITLGGASTAVTGSGIQTVDVGTATEISATTPLRITHDTVNTGTGWAQLIIGGTVITDNTGEDYDLMVDTPTNNYAALNPLNTTGGDAGIKNANLSLSDTGSGAAAAYTGTTSMQSGKFYFEFTYVSADNTSYYGIKSADLAVTNGNAGLTEDVHVDTSGGLIINGSSTSNYLPAITVGDVVNVAFDADSGQVWFGRNGEWVGDPDSGSNEAHILPDNGTTGYVSWMRVIGGSGTDESAINHGQRDFLYTPPELFVTEPVDSSQYFQTITTVGSSILSAAQTAFPQGLWWIKDRVNTDQHQFVDSLRGNNIMNPCPTGTYTMIDHPYDPPSGDSVAWCWSAPEAFTPNVSEFTDASGTRNLDAGFSIVLANNATGVSGASYEHGLNETPEFIIGKSRTNAFNWIVYHSSLTDAPNTQHFLYLSGNSSEINNNAPMFDLRTSGQVILGTNVGTNRASDDFVYYNWHSVPGYSKIGSYLGNGEQTGTYVETGFRPSYILIKAVDQVADWQILDAARDTDPDGVVSVRLEASANGVESSDASNAIRFLPNGFQFLSTSGNQNSPDGAKFIYMAIGSAKPVEEPAVVPTENFTSVLFPYTQQTISGLDFAPDLVWLKVRNNTWNHRLYDTIRGTLAPLESNNGNAENTSDTDGLNSFTADGFTHLGLGASGSDNYVAWCWKAGGADVTNNNGDITSQVSANTDAGFSIVSYTGNNTVSQTVGHGLNQAPELIILKNRSRVNATSWIAFSSAISPSGTIDSGSPLYPTLLLDSSAAGFLDTEDSVWDPTATTFRVRPSTSSAGNWCNNSDDFVAYCWHSVPGYSKVSNYTGNGEGNSGPIVETGFRPAWVLIKNINDGGTEWKIYDNKRTPSNPGSLALHPNLNFGDQQTSSPLNFLDNGFQVMGSFDDVNTNGDTYVYLAIAGEPEEEIVPTQHQGSITYTGNGSTQSVSGFGFQPDLVWIKGRDNNTNHVLVDAVRGATKVLESDSTAAEYTDAQSIQSFDTNGFTLGNSNDVNNNGSGRNKYVAWGWKAGGTAVTNTYGSITSQVSANPEAGFSIITYSNAGSNTVGHGLNQAPQIYFEKKRNTSSNWLVTTNVIDGSMDYLTLNTTNTKADASAAIGQPTATVLDPNAGSDDIICYAWHSVPGYSQVGTYQGTGDIDGPYIRTGFKPGWIMWKNTNSAENWVIVNSATSSEIPANRFLRADETAVEQTGAATVYLHDDGFELANNDDKSNRDGDTYLYMAFAEYPTPDKIEGAFKEVANSGTETSAILNGRDHFQAITAVGPSILSAAQTEFPQGLWWIKDRVVQDSHRLVDSVRGSSVCLRSNNTETETPYVAPAGNSVAWCWKAGDSTVTNTDGTRTSQVSANPTAGFSIVTYTGQNISGQTFGHGLTEAPEFIILKCRNLTNTLWAVYHPVLGQMPVPSYLTLNTSGAITTVGANVFVGADESTVSVGSYGYSGSNYDYVAYCWHSVPGYSQIGSFEGNGSADGPFVELSFRPAWIMFKASNQSSSWQIIDTTRDPVNNGTSTVLQPNESAGENINILDSVDILSNGFKIRDSGGFNGSGWNIAYIAFAENPFSETGVPPTAR